ncbi:MAG: hypothetical protein AB7N71_03345 [Phycisphaerae bacterium]
MPHVDIHELPMPNWHIPCPQCNHPLNGISEHRCPECGLRFSMDDVAQTFHRFREPTFTGAESPLPDFGLKCKSCHTPLAGAVNHTCPNCERPFAVDEFRPADDWIALSELQRLGLTESHVEGLLAREFIPYRRESDQKWTDVYMGSTLTPMRNLVAREFYFDALHAIAAEVVRISKLGDDDEWTCTNCGDTNPPSFETCWKCSQPQQ